MNIIRTCALTGAAVLALGTVSACGDDPAAPETASGSSAGAATGVQLPTVSSDVFAEQGNQVCQATNEAIGSRFQAMSTPPKPAELTAAYDNVLKESYKFVGDILAIGAPEGQERELLDLLVQQQKVTKTVEAEGQQAFFADEDSDPWGELATTLAADFGLTECGHEG